MADKTTKELEKEKVFEDTNERESSEKLFRYLRVADTDFEDDQTVQVAFSSEFPGQQRASKTDEKLGIAKEGEIYNEVLSHDPSDVDLTQLNNRGAFLDEHVNIRHLGSVSKAALSKDGKCRAALKFDGASKLSKTRQKQMRSGDRPHISFGYTHTKYLGRVALEGGEVGHKFSFSATEISSVADPMDPTVGKNRAKGDNCHCLGCGDIFKRAEVNKEFYCADCADASEPSEPSEDAARASEVEAFKRKAAIMLPAADETVLFRAKKDSEATISHSDLKSKVSQAADASKQFKVKRPNGNVYSDYYVHDVQQTGDDYKAIIVGPEYKYYECPFSFDGDSVTLGDCVEVQPKQTFEPVGEKRSAVDLNKLPNDRINLRTKLMADEIKPITPEQVIDSLENKHVRAALETKGYIERKTVEAEANDRDSKLRVRNKEILDLATEFNKDFGDRVGKVSVDGKPTPFYLRDKISIAALEACAMDGTKPATEVRQIFRSRVDDLKRDSKAAPNLLTATDAPEEVASRCDMFGSIRAMIKEAKKRGTMSTALKPFEGAELEADQGIRAQLSEIPGSGRILDLGGVIFPHSLRSKVQRKGASGRLSRDFLAGDFSTGGALVQPDFMPYIELLRNRIVMAELGATFLGGLQGDVVFPRQDASTVAQSVAEGAQLLPYDQVLGQIKMQPHRVGSRQYYSRLAILQPSYDAESLIWNDHSKVLAIYMDEMAINGTGAADQPLGILNQPGINQIIFGGTPTYAQIVNFRTQIRKFNVSGPLAFATTSVGQGRLAVLPETLVGSTIVSGSTAAIWKGDELDGTILGTKAMASQQIPNDILLAGVFENLLIGSWGGIVSIVDNFTRADRDEIALTLNTYFDVAVRHAEAFTRSADSVNQ